MWIIFRRRQFINKSNVFCSARPPLSATSPRRRTMKSQPFVKIYQPFSIGNNRPIDRQIALCSSRRVKCDVRVGSTFAGPSLLFLLFKYISPVLCNRRAGIDKTRENMRGRRRERQGGRDRDRDREKERERALQTLF